MNRLPTLFLSHGSPDVAIAETAATRFLRDLAVSLPRPKAIVVASAHFESDRVLLSADAKPDTIHDFGGFDPRLYDMRYPAPGDPELAEDLARRLRGVGFDAAAVRQRGYDHGTWVPLILAYPEADIPVVQLSVDPMAGPAHHLKLGQALSALPSEDVLVIGSGSFTHNLRAAFTAMSGGRRDAEAPHWVVEFADWMREKIEAGDTEALVDYRTRAPFAVENHPSDEHLMPLFVALGAAGDGGRVRRLHSSHDFGALAMDAYAFGDS
ncbi:dioxygenase family protein [Consotaella salsifontis]|uniref:4,5-DOPA dioxygenase extradiol n=1 Tax=Consotaella salsifontis TaxID=1365950 RepID=A0A1T4P6Q4_9HYPH|nr:class III extradiol ring-cleavage dioxygenase [Consotaella salsifontis]SJZ87081.1 4,5-DOPA dioxygenase extradiol [Consotaella salsifontis]